MTKYLLDANIFIQAKRDYYDFNVCPGFWDWLICQYTLLAKSLSIDKVYSELNSGNDELVNWIHSDGSILFEKTNPIQTGEVFDQFTAWLEKENYESKGNFYIF